MSTLDLIQKIREEENLPASERIKKIREESVLDKLGKFAKNVGFAALTENPILKPLRQPPPEKLSKFMRENSLEDMVDYSIQTAKEGAEKWAAYTKEKDANKISRFFADTLATVLPENLNEFTMNAAIGGMAGQEIFPVMEGLSRKLPRILEKVPAQKTEQIAKKYIMQEFKKFAKTPKGAERIKESMNFIQNIKKHAGKTTGLFDEALEKFNKIPDQNVIKKFVKKPIDKYTISNLTLENASSEAKNIYNMLYGNYPKDIPKPLISNVSNDIMREMKKYRFAQVTKKDLFDSEKIKNIPDFKVIEISSEEIKNIEKYAGSINLERQDISNIAKQMELETFEKYGVKKTVTNEETIKEAQKIIKKFQDDPKYFAERVELIKQGKTPTTAEELAHRIVNATNQENFIEAARKTARGEMSVEDFRALEDMVKDQQLKVVDPLASETGRRLQMYKIEVGKYRAFKAVAKLDKGLNDRQLAEFNHLAEGGFDPREAEIFVQRLPDPKLREYFYEFWYNSILSGIPTQIVNVTNNTAWMIFQATVHQALVGGIDKLMSGVTLGKRARQTYIREIIPMWAGMKKGFQKGAAGAKEVFKTAQLKDFNTKFNLDMGERIASAFQRSPNKKLRKLDLPVNWPTRGLIGMDVWGRSIAMDAKLGALAKRKALQTATSKEMQDIAYKHFLKNPTDEMLEEAANFGKYAVFADEPGKITRGIDKIRKGIPFEAGRLIIPFVNTIGNLLKRGVEMTPIAGVAMARGQKPAEVIAKQIEGAIITFLLANKVANGEVIGSVPESDAEKEAFYRQGKQPWSIRFGGETTKEGAKKGGTYISFRRVEPFNTVLASISEFYKHFIKNPDDKGVGEKFMNVVEGVKNNLIDSSYLDGVSTLLNRAGKWKNIGKRQLVSLVPYSGFMRSIVGAVESMYEGYRSGGLEGMLTEGYTKVRDAKNFLGEFYKIIPGLYGENEPRLDVWGEDIVIEGNFFRQWLPFKWSTGTTDPVELTLEEIGYYPGLPSQTVTNQKGEEIKLSDSEYRDYVKAVGKRGKQTLMDIIFGPQFQKWDSDIKAAIIDRELTKIRRSELKRIKGITTKPDASEIIK